MEIKVTRFIYFMPLALEYKCWNIKILYFSIIYIFIIITYLSNMFNLQNVFYYFSLFI